MQVKKIITVCIFSLLTNFSFGQKVGSALTSQTIKVWGNCGMCKTKIEKAARTAGAAKASWNEETKELKVTYSSRRSSGAKIQQAVAKAGYDTEEYTADAAVYQKLHACCQYERKVPAVKQ